ncbi:MAG: DUF411 domain-containing protein [Longimicrobiales bacterium]
MRHGTKGVVIGLTGLGLIAGAAALLVHANDDDSPATATPAASARADARGVAITVYKSPTCGCCTSWVEHLREHGFAVEAIDTDTASAVKARLGVPAHLGACHTAVVQGKVVEGHVPADVILAFLADSTDARGLAVPGMPIGSPGMEAPFAQPYDVFAFDADGGASVYASR